MIKISNSQRKLVASLDKAKSRRETGLFKAEGTKCVLDTVGAFQLEYLIVRHDWLEENRSIVAKLPSDKIFEGEKADFERMTHLSSPPEVIAVYHIPRREFHGEDIADELVIALDDLQDPGNLGTIVRMADWFGINTIICSHSTVDIYNTKTVMATMGAISRVNVYYCDLAETLSDLSKRLPIYGTFLNGDNIFATSLSSRGVIVMGNEGRGISDEVKAVVTESITIPSFPHKGQSTTSSMESLNVAMAASIVISQFKSHGKN